MNDNLPSYEAATARDPLRLIAPYIRRQDLFQASLVCRHWYAVFSQVIWESPGRCWGLGERSALKGFLDFTRTILHLPQSSHPSTSHHTTTLDFSSIDVSVYTTLPQHWLYLLFSKMPCLRHVNLSNVNFVSHENLIFFTKQPRPVSVYVLRTLQVQGCHNMTTKSLLGFLRPGWPQLEVLDISGSRSAGHTQVLEVVASEMCLPSLRKLVIRNLELRDGALEILAKGLGTRINELDIRENLISDVGLGFLLDYCILPPEYDVGGRVTLGGPAYTAQPQHAYNTAPQVTGGLTSLLLSKNLKVSWTAVESLIRTTRLQSFDCGNISELTPYLTNRHLLPVLSMYAHKNLHYLRIDFRLITPVPSTSADDLTEVQTAPRLIPTMLPNLRRLVLCAVPHYTPSLFGVMEGLKQFLDDLVDAEEEIERTHGKGGLRYLALLVLEMQPLSVTEDSGVGMYGSGMFDQHCGASDSEEDMDGIDQEFSFFDDTGEEGSGGWGTGERTTEKMGVGKTQAEQVVGKQKETLLNVLADLENFRTEGRQGGRKYWPGQVKVVRDMGWDDQGGVERDSAGVSKWGVVEERV